MAIRRQSVVLGLLLAPVTLFLGVFFLLPLLIIAVFSLLTPGLYGGVEWTFYHWNYGRIFGWADGLIEIFEPIYLQILLRSLGFAAMTVLLTLVLCYPVAFWVSRLPSRLRLVFMFLITLPFFSSLIVRLYAWLLILKPSGLLNTVLLSIGADLGTTGNSLHPHSGGAWAWSMSWCHSCSCRFIPPSITLTARRSRPVFGPWRQPPPDLPESGAAANPARHHGRGGDCVYPLGGQLRCAGCAGRGQRA